MTYLVKVNRENGPRFYYALGGEALDTLLAALYANGPVNTFLTVVP